MNLGSLLGGGDKPAGSPGIGGSGKGASGAATIFGDNSPIGASSTSPLLLIVAGLIGLALVGLIVMQILKK